ncbi:MAG: phosphotransferase [Myxococcales bacterium]|nr:phosphotransferase [Myxococcales bacterium]
MRYFQNLGATFIKVGQIMSTRPDLLPEYIVDQLRLLQDQVDPFPFVYVKEAVENTLNCEISSVFEEIDETPIASASVAQVHRAVLRNEQVEVAVKVLRPNIRKTVALDEKIMIAVAKVVSLIPTANLLAPVESVQEFCNAIRNQLDLRLEADNNDEFTAQFQTVPHVRFPTLYRRWCTSDVLVMEFIHGIKSHQYDLSYVNASKLARIGVDAVLRMIFEYGFVHADLHPGNILLEAGPKVTFIDLGMVGRIDDRRRRALAELFFAITQNDGRTVARIMFEMSPTKHCSDYDAYESDVAAFIQNFYSKSLGEIQVSLLIAQVFRIIRRHNIRCEPAFTLINVAFIVMEGLGKRLDPSMKMVEQTLPFLQRLLMPSQVTDNTKS